METVSFLQPSSVCHLRKHGVKLIPINSGGLYDRDLALVANLNKLKKVPFKKSDIAIAVDYMSMAAITAIIEQPDASTPKGLRDQCFMILLSGQK